MAKLTNQTFPYLELLSGREMQRYFDGLKIEDDEDITALMIVNTDEAVPERIGSCILIDKDGTSSYYLPECPLNDQITSASLLTCFEKITANHKDALDCFIDEISNVVAMFDGNAADKLLKSTKGLQ
ncbi:hypothetical protein HUO09_17555 [Vibrio sp. Y2-5]|uniref:hypothetical protein n=1 Tax=Vibrio sp. Y2-5 TaxID=2743977 RepID=UPI001660F484|nr:hypothetical protein [Vibrio sp. Y2-5]MBD0788164.1 hypothetical protein [Vibrio sp. Y2-5]